jgi:hypothetical protein
MDTNQHELRKHHGGVSYNMDWEVSRWESGSVSPHSKALRRASEIVGNVEVVGLETLDRGDECG